jgi:hypothetical protein
MKVSVKVYIWWIMDREMEGRGKGRGDHKEGG